MGSAIYPGSFDPVTNGHVNLIERAARTFDRVVVAVAYNIRKTGLFSVEERLAMLRESTASIPGVEVDAFDGLLVDYMRRQGVRVVLRGLRAVSDFEYEFQMAHMNYKLNPAVETLFMMTGQEHFYVSSQTVKEVASLGGNVDVWVPPVVVQRLKEKYGR